MKLAKGGGRHGARRAVVQALYQWQLNGEDISQRIDTGYALEHAKGVEQTYFEQTISGIIEHLPELDQKLTPYLDRDLVKIDPIERAILRLGAYELVFCLDVPYKVILNEAIDLTKAFGADQGHKYVNAVLDKLAVVVRAGEMA